MIKTIIEDFKRESSKDILVGIRDNFFFGFLGAMLVVFISTKTDILVLFGYVMYYLYMGKIVNRDKYNTLLGKYIVFPFPSSIGAYTGYKISLILTNLLQ